MTPEELDHLARQAHEALMSEQLDLGLALTDQCVRARPAEPVFYCWRARALMEMDKFTEAVQQARQAVLYGPEMLEAHMVLADACAVLGRNMEAQNAFREAIKLSRRDPAVLRAYALFMATECGPKLGEQAALEAIEADADATYAWTALGISQLRQHRHAEAESSLNRAVELDNENTWAKMNLAVVLGEMGKQAKAQALLKLLQGDPEADDFVAAARQSDREREIAQRLLERPEYVEAVFRPEPRRWPYYALRIVSAILSVVAAVGILKAGGPLMLAAIAIPLLLVWWKYRHRARGGGIGDGYQ